MNREGKFPVSGILLDEGSMETSQPHYTPYGVPCISIPALCWNVAGALHRRPGPSEMLVSPSQPPSGEKEGKMGFHSRGTPTRERGCWCLVLVR